MVNHLLYVHVFIEKQYYYYICSTCGTRFVFKHASIMLGFYALFIFQTQV